MIIDPSILYEDDDLLVINKPAGVVVNRAETHDVATLQDWFISRSRAVTSVNPEMSQETWSSLVPPDFDLSFGSPEELFEQRQGMVHRLDKNTSGVMIWARNPGSLVNLLKQFKERLVHKTYLALIHGKLSLPVGTIHAPIGRASQDRKQFTVRSDGRAAVTEYQVLSEYRELSTERVEEYLQQQPKWIALPDQLTVCLKELRQRQHLYQGFSLISCQPQTGRTHQIRVHFKHLQHPIVGDSVYVGKRKANLDAVWCPRQFLHAAQLRLTHPRTGAELIFAAPLTTDLETTLGFLET